VTEQYILLRNAGNEYKSQSTLHFHISEQFRFIFANSD